MAITITRDLNMVPVGVPPVIHLSQYDDDFSLVFNLYSSVGTFTVESSTTAEIRGTKEDGYGYSANATIDISNKRVTVAGNNQMTACAGQNTFELVLKKNNKVLSTVNFILDVEHAALDAGTIQDESVLKELNAIIAGAATATRAASDASASAAAAAESARTLTIDNTLTQQGQAADAKKVGDEITELKDDLSDITGLSDPVKEALLACFRHVAFLDEDADYYGDLYDALYEDEPHPQEELLYELDNEDFLRGNKLEVLTPFYISNSGRICYRQFDLLLSGGCKYKMQAISSHNTAKIGYHFINQEALNKAKNNQSFSWNDVYDPGWRPLSEVLEIPLMQKGSNIACVRMSIKQYDDDAAITNDFSISSFTITKINDPSYSPVLYRANSNDIQNNVGLSYDSPNYVSNPADNRSSYSMFRFLLNGGKKYRFKASCNYATAQMGCQFFSEKQYNNYLNGRNLSYNSGNGYDPGWQSLDTIIDVPVSGADGTAIKGVRFTFRQSTDNPTIASDFLVDYITIAEVTE